MTEFIGSVLEEAKIMAITNVVLNLTEQYGHIGMICCTEPELTETLHVLYIHLITYKM
jgi:hypothetical protein